MPAKITRRGTAFIDVIKNARLIQRRRYGDLEEEATTEDEADLGATLVRCAEKGDYPRIRRILLDYPDIKINTRDALGRTPLQLAINGDHEEIVELLVPRADHFDIYECLIHAIGRDRINIAKRILLHPRYNKKVMDRITEVQGVEGDFIWSDRSFSGFPLDITPVMLAAQRNLYEIVQIFLLKGETIPKPHQPRCGCKNCKKTKGSDELRLARSRIEAYKGLASESYLALAAKDPILTALQLQKELRAIANTEKSFKSQYLDIADGISDTLAKFLDHVETTSDLKNILDKHGQPGCDKFKPFARFNMAMDYGEKKFIAQPSCQKILVSSWLGVLGKFEKTNIIAMTILSILFIISYPFMVIGYLLAPKSKLGKFLRTPVLKFIASTGSYIVFIVLLLTVTISFNDAHVDLLKANHTNRRFDIIRDFYTQYKNDIGESLERKLVVRMPEMKNFIWLVLIAVWVLGMLWQEITQLYDRGPKKYFKSWYNYMDIMMLALYITTLTLIFFSYGWVKYCLDNVYNKKWFWESLKTENSTMHKTAKFSYYWLRADRHNWDAMDPTVIAEGLFAIANVVTFSRLSYILPASEVLGPLQITLGRIIKAILKFMLLFLIVCFAFLAGFRYLYWYYTATNRADVEGKRPTDATKTPASFAFDGFLDTVRTMFWIILGMRDTDVVNLNPGFKTADFTETVGHVLLACYLIIVVIILLNMFIAMLTDSYSSVKKSTDIEWKYARSSLYMDYFGEGRTLAVPFNIIPSPKSMFYMLRGIWRCCAGESKPSKMAEFEFGEIHGNSIAADGAEGMDVSSDGVNPDSVRPKISQEDNEVSESSYEITIKRIVRRLILASERAEDTNAGATDELKMDLSAMRFEILNGLSQEKYRHEELRQKINTMNDRLKLTRGLTQVPE